MSIFLYLFIKKMFQLLINYNYIIIILKKYIRILIHIFILDQLFDAKRNKCIHLIICIGYTILTF